MSIELDVKRHRYTVVVDGERLRVPSVTRICGIVDKSTPISIWATKNTIEYIRSEISPNVPYSLQELEGIYGRARWASDGKKGEAASIGKAAHAWIDNYVATGVEAPLSLDAPHRPCVEAFLKWFDQNDVQLLDSERPIYSLTHKYSGRLDAVAIVNKKKCLLDWKSWKSGGIVYPEARFQTAAYQSSWQEETGEQIEVRHIIKLEKDTGEFDCHSYPTDKYFEPDFRAFLAAKTLFESVQAAEKEEKKKLNKKSWLEELNG